MGPPMGKVILVNLLRRPGTPYVVAFILAVILGAVTYHFNSAVANFVIGAGLLCLAAGIGFKAVDAARSDKSEVG